MSGLRIVAGELGGRRIRVPRVPGLRPTPERVREALFSILGPGLEGAVLDLYSGSGALGFEALSRGATPAVFVEVDRVAVRALEQNAERLGVLERCKFHHGRVLDQLPRVRGRFSLILADPPYSEEDAKRYGTPMVNRNTALKEATKILKPGGNLVWLDQVWPMFRKAELRLWGVIGVIRSTNHRVRAVFIFEKLDPAATGPEEGAAR